ncbi:helix-turn-helix transcriptional regulator [Nonomuraea indica]|uniref:helix-turn-helix transcriptional regulator n=1 Tax=Nonomuraea indica TaxID=1581193 RepID=UPI000C7C15B7|nr:helix-turn-helix domain-containing protein [Nonomuraea indica]
MNTRTATTLAHAAARGDAAEYVADIATRLRLAKMTVYRLIDAGTFPGTIRVGRSIRVPAAAVEAYLKGSVITP